MKKYKILLFEFKRLRYNKLILWLALGAIIGLFIFAGASYSAQESAITEKSQTHFNKEKKLEYYQKTIDLNLEELLEPDLTAGHKRDLEKQIKEYTYYLEHNITESDCLDIYNPQSKVVGREGIGFSFYLLENALYFLLAFAVLAATYVFAFDYSDGRIKNILSAPVKRKSVFKQKTLFVFLIISIVNLLVFVSALGFGAFNGGENFLIYYKGQFYRLNCIFVLFTKFIGLYILTLLLAAAVWAVAVFSKNVMLAAAIPAALYGISFAVFWMIIEQNTIVNASDKSIIALKWIPFLGVRQYSQYGFTLAYVCILLAHSAAAVCFYFAAKYKFLRQDI